MAEAIRPHGAGDVSNRALRGGGRVCRGSESKAGGEYGAHPEGKNLMVPIRSGESKLAAQERLAENFTISMARAWPLHFSSQEKGVRSI
jgi:hypothetical protein